MIPGLREEQIGVLLRALPKTIRKPLMPLEPKVREVAGEFDPGRADFRTALAAFLTRKYPVPVRAEDWPPESLPSHLRPRVEVVDQKKNTLAAGRDLAAVRAHLDAQEVHSGAWERAARHWEKGPLTEWSIGDLPEAIPVEQVDGVPLLAYPGLELRDDAVRVRLFRKREEVIAAAPPAVRKLAELVLARDLARLWKDLGSLGRHIPAAPKPGKAAPSFHAALQQMSAKIQTPTAPDFTAEALQKTGYENLLAHALRLDPVLPLTQSRFIAFADHARRELPALTYQLGEWLRQILQLRAAILASPKRYPGLESDLARLAPPDFLARTPYARLPHLHRYLRAVPVRAERAAVSPAKDMEKAKQLTPFAGWEKRVPQHNRDTYRWLLEEFRVSLFAQELGTAQPVSPKRLKELETA
jgi:ATP-dependent helicase HrpA